MKCWLSIEMKIKEWRFGFSSYTKYEWEWFRRHINVTNKHATTVCLTLEVSNYIHGKRNINDFGLNAACFNADVIFNAAVSFRWYCMYLFSYYRWAHILCYFKTRCGLLIQAYDYRLIEIVQIYEFLYMYTQKSTLM